MAQISIWAALIKQRSSSGPRRDADEPSESGEEEVTIDLEPIVGISTEKDHVDRAHDPESDR